MDADLLVVGGGPVGLATAAEAALAGMSVVLVERRQGPVDKACGEGLMPAAREGLARLGVHPVGLEFRGIRYLAPGHEATAVFRGGAGLGVRRTTLSRALGERVDELGVRRVTANIPAPVVRERWAEVAGVRGRWLVAADGLHSPVRRAAGLDRAGDRARDRARDRRPRYGLRRHYVVEPWTDLVEVYWADHAEAYVTPVGGGVVGVAVLGPGGRPYEDWLRDFPALRDRLGAALPATPVRGAGPLRQRAASRRRGPVLLVGDAAGYVDALTGEGISVGLASARELVRCLVAGRPEDYDRAWRRVTRRYRLLTGGLLWAAGREPLRRSIVPTAERLPGVFARVVDQLG